jgi:hypothetical protein
MLLPLQLLLQGTVLVQSFLKTSSSSGNAHGTACRWCFREMHPLWSRQPQQQQQQLQRILHCALAALSALMALLQVTAIPQISSGSRF